MGVEDEDGLERFKQQQSRRWAASHRRRMRWWRHAREYLSLKRLITRNLYRPVHPEPSHERWMAKANRWEKPTVTRRY